MTPLPDGEKLSSLEERLAKLEASLREKAIDERIENLEYQADESSDADSEGSEQHSVEGEGQKALFLALANFLNSGALKEAFTAVGDLIKQHSESKLKEAEAQAKEAGAQREFAWKANRMGLLFSALVFILLCGLLWLDKITKELAAGLIGSLIGYWYGHQKDK